MQQRITSAGTSQISTQQPIHIHLHHSEMTTALHRQQHQIDDVRNAFQHTIKVLLLLFVDRSDVEQSSAFDNVFGKQYEYGVDIFEFRLIALVEGHEIV